MYHCAWILSCTNPASTCPAGFERWNKIYGETDDVNKVQLDIRTGHAQTVDKVLNWLDEEGGVKETTVCDCGCGTGSLAIPLALKGAAVTASDISASMVGEAKRRYTEAVGGGAAAPATAPVWEAKDLESASGTYDVVTCLDVMIHYPQVRLHRAIARRRSESNLQGAESGGVRQRHFFRRVVHCLCRACVTWLVQFCQWCQSRLLVRSHCQIP
jgi:SAM-dependent methyltransferase